MTIIETGKTYYAFSFGKWVKFVAASIKNEFVTSTKGHVYCERAVELEPKAKKLIKVRTV